MYVCQDCKGENVEARAWVDLNIDNATPDYITMDDSDTWCRDCEEHTGVEFVNEEEKESNHATMPGM